MEVLTIEKGALKRLISDNAEMKRLMLLLSEKVDKIFRKGTDKAEKDFITKKEAAYLIKKTTKTVDNFCSEYIAEIRRKKEGRENLIHKNDLLSAYKSGRKTAFNRGVFNNQK